MPRLFLTTRILAAACILGSATAAHSAGNDPSDGRSVLGYAVPSTGSTAGESRDGRGEAPVRRAPGSIGPSSASDRQCAALRQAYARSQACWQRFRLQNGGLRPGAAQQCKQLINPSLKCGPEIVG